MEQKNRFLWPYIKVHLLWVLLVLLLTVPVFVFEIVRLFYETSKILITPEVAQITGLAGYLHFVILGAALVFLVFVLKNTWKKIWHKKISHKVGLAFVTLFFIVLGLGAGFVSPFFIRFPIFEGKYIQKQISGDGNEVAYLYTTGLFCGHKLYVKKKGEWVIHQKVLTGFKCNRYAKNPSPQILWNEKKEPYLLYPDGAINPNDPTPLFIWH